MRPVICRKKDKESEEEFYRPSFAEIYPQWYHEFKVVDADGNESVNYEIQCPLSEEDAAKPEWDRSRLRRTHASPMDFCAEITNIGHVCNRKVADTELMMCGIHARKSRDRNQAAEDSRASSSARQYVQDALQPFLETLQREFGMESATLRVGYAKTKNGDYIGEVTVEASELAGALMVPMQEEIPGMEDAVPWEAEWDEDDELEEIEW